MLHLSLKIKIELTTVPSLHFRFYDITMWDSTLPNRGRFAHARSANFRTYNRADFRGRCAHILHTHATKFPFYRDRKCKIVVGLSLKIGQLREGQTATRLVLVNIINCHVDDEGIFFSILKLFPIAQKVIGQCCLLDNLKEIFQKLKTFFWSVNGD